MEDFFTEIKWQDIVTMLSIVFGLISLVAYLDQRKSNKMQSQYLEFVSRQLDRDITKEEVDHLINKKSELTSEIEEKLPQIGRSVVLQDQAEFYQRGIHQNYQALQEINAKLAEEGTTNIKDLNPALKDFILKEVSPQFKLEKLITQTRDRVLALLALIIAIGVILPFGIDYYVQLVLGIFLSEAILKYMVLNANDEKEKEKIYKNAAGLISLSGLGILLFAAVQLLPYWETETDKISLAVFIWGSTALLGLVLLLFGKQIVQRLRKRIEQEIA